MSWIKDKKSNYLKRCRELRVNSTDSEILLWQNLKAKKLKGLKFKRQVNIGLYIVDFICNEAKVIIELDGLQHINNTKYDIERTAYLTAMRYKELRFWNYEVLNNIDSVKSIIFAECSKRTFKYLKPPRPLAGEGVGGEGIG